MRSPGGERVTRPPTQGAIGLHEGSARLDLIATSIIGPVFLALAAWFLLGPDPDLVFAEPVEIDPASISSEPRRPFKAVATMKVAGFDKACQDCASPSRRRPRREHGAAA